MSAACRGEATTESVGERGAAAEVATELSRTAAAGADAERAEAVADRGACTKHAVQLCMEVANWLT
jgi:hypothetical protein